MGVFGQEWPWFAIQVRTCAEKSAVTVLQYKGYECFLPLSMSRRRWSDRIKEFEVPLFSGYLFCRFDVLHRLPILQTPGVLGIVGVAKTPVPVPDEEIAAIQRVVDSGVSAQPWPFLRVGQRVRIEQGPLAGLEGFVVSVRSHCQLVVSVTLLQRSVAVEIEPTWLGLPVQTRTARR